MGNKHLEEVKNPRLRSLKDKTLMNLFKMMNVSGKKNVGPDVASRYPGSPSVPLEETLVSLLVANDGDDLDMVHNCQSQRRRFWMSSKLSLGTDCRKQQSATKSVRH